MSLRIDFLNKTERRYQGIVSTKVMVLGSIGVLAGTTILVLSLVMISKATQTANFKRAQREWERINPLTTAVRQNGVAAEENRKTIARMDLWAQGGSASMHTILRAVQQELPERVQLNNLRAGIEKKTADEPVAYHLRLSGRALGELVAVEAKRKLTDNETIQAFCGDIRLVSSEREQGDVWTFALEGRRLMEESK